MAEQERNEAPTWILIAAIYTGWLGLTWFYQVLPWWLVLPLGGWFVAWHNSFQHEALHGHPSRHEWLNTLLAWPPLGLWMPYCIYRESHLAHHDTPTLTDPLDDPESFYVTAVAWQRAGRVTRALLVANNTLAGRMIIGPWLVALRFWGQEARCMLHGDFRNTRRWLLHAALSATLLCWIVLVCGIPATEYVLLFAWPGLALTLMRSYTEHRPADAQNARSAIVEAGRPLALLYLNNNLHLVHHDRPGLAWYRLPAAYRDSAEDYRARNSGFRFAGGYAEIARRFLLRPKDIPAHPG